MFGFMKNFNNERLRSQEHYLNTRKRNLDKHEDFIRSEIEKYKRRVDKRAASDLQRVGKLKWAQDTYGKKYRKAILDNGKSLKRKINSILEATSENALAIINPSKNAATSNISSSDSKVNVIGHKSASKLSFKEPKYKNKGVGRIASILSWRSSKKDTMKNKKNKHKISSNNLSRSSKSGESVSDTSSSQSSSKNRHTDRHSSSRGRRSSRSSDGHHKHGSKTRRKGRKHDRHASKHGRHSRHSDRRSVDSDRHSKKHGRHSQHRHRHFWAYPSSSRYSKSSVSSSKSSNRGRKRRNLSRGGSSISLDKTSVTSSEKVRHLRRKHASKPVFWLINATSSSGELRRSSKKKKKHGKSDIFKIKLLRPKSSASVSTRPSRKYPSRHNRKKHKDTEVSSSNSGESIIVPNISRFFSKHFRKNNDRVAWFLKPKYTNKESSSDTKLKAAKKSKKVPEKPKTLSKYLDNFISDSSSSSDTPARKKKPSKRAKKLNSKASRFLKSPSSVSSDSINFNKQKPKKSPSKHGDRTKKPEPSKNPENSDNILEISTLSPSKRSITQIFPEYDKMIARSGGYSEVRNILNLPFLREGKNNLLRAPVAMLKAPQIWDNPWSFGADPAKRPKLKHLLLCLPGSLLLMPCIGLCMIGYCLTKGTIATTM